jgi:hypothetical protein
VTSGTTAYEGIDANTGLLISLVFAWMLLIVGVIPVIRSLDPATDQTLLSFILVAIIVLFLGTVLLPFRRITASINEAEFRFSRRSVVSWMLGRAAETAVVPLGDIQWVRVDRNPWADGVIVIQTRSSGCFRIPMAGSNSKAAPFRDALLRLAGSPGQIEVKPNWWSTSHGRTRTVVIAVVSLGAAVSAVLVDMDSKLRGTIVLGGLVLFGFAAYFMYAQRKN